MACLKTTFNSIVEKHAPLRTKRVKASKSPRITSHLKDEMHKKSFKKSKRFVLMILKSGFLLEKCVIQLIKRFFRRKKPILKMLFAKGNPKKTWKIINELTSKNRKATPACFKRRILHASNSIVLIMYMLSATSETIKFDVSNCGRPKL